MRVGVTGASGFIGSALVAALLDRGDEVVRFLRPDSATTPGPSVRWDPRTGVLDDGELRRMERLDAVVNLAGAGVADRRWSKERKAEIRSSRVSSTALLVRALADSQHETTHLVSGSAIGIYGARPDQPVDESAPLGNDFLAEVCQEWEAAARPHEDRGARVSFLRTGIVLDAAGGVLRRQLPLYRLGLGGALGSGHQWHSVISLRDQVAATLWILDHPTGGPFNLVSPTPVTERQFASALARALHRPAVLRVPSIALRLVLGGELTSTAVLASQRVVPAALRTSGFEFVHADLTSILADALKRR